MGQFEKLKTDLTYTDPVVDAQIIRDRARGIVGGWVYPQWDHLQALSSLFIEVSEDDYGSSVGKTKHDLLPEMALEYGVGEEKQREDCAFLLALTLRHWTEKEFSFTTNFQGNDSEDLKYAQGFMMELVLPEARVRKLMEGATDRLIYASVMQEHGTTVKTTYRRLQELDLL